MKGNQAELLQAVTLWLQQEIRQGGQPDVAKTNKGHGRVEKRELWIVESQELGAYLDGDFCFTAGMMQAGVRQPDAMGRAVGWDNVVKHHGPNAWGAQVCRTDSFDVPYRCLVPRHVDGLLMGAGRSISTDNPWLLRVMAHTMVFGQGARVAAAMAAKTGATTRGVDIASVQAELGRQGVAL